MGPQDAEPPGLRAGGAHGIGPRGVRVGAGLGEASQADVQLGVGDGLEVVLDPADRAQRREAPLGVVAVLGQVLAHQRIEQAAVLLAQGPLLDEDLSQGPGLVQDPGVHGGDQRVARDEVHLERDDPEQQVAIGSGRRHRRALRRASRSIIIIGRRVDPS